MAGNAFISLAPVCGVQVNKKNVLKAEFWILNAW